jgi:hypothetical protein
MTQPVEPTQPRFAYGVGGNEEAMEHIRYLEARLAEFIAAFEAAGHLIDGPKGAAVVLAEAITAREEAERRIQEIQRVFEGTTWAEAIDGVIALQKTKSALAASEARAAALEGYKALADEMAAYMHAPVNLDAENWQCSRGHEWPIVHPVSNVSCPECGRGPVSTDSKMNPEKWNFSKKDWLTRYDALSQSAQPEGDR